MGGQAAQDFNLTVIYIPQTGASIAPQLADVGQLYQFTLPTTAFINLGDESLSYFAAQQNGAALPAWLKFNASLQQFSGLPNITDSGDYSLIVTAVDGQGLSAAASLSLRVEDFPYQNRPITPPLAGVNLPFLFTLPFDTFVDTDGES